jgi:hypothetical protein
VRLWGRVAGGLLLAFAAVFAVVALAVPEARGPAALAALVMAAAGWLGVPALVRLLSRFTGDEAVLERGTPADAAITAMAATGWRYNVTAPIVRFDLSVRLGATPYAARVTQVVPPGVLGSLAPGAIVAVRVDRDDRRRVVIDWRRAGHRPR